MWQKLAPSKKFEAEKQQKQDKSRKMFLSTSEKSPLPENCCGHEERQQVKKQPLYIWLRLVFSHWDVISPIFKFSDTVRKVIYTTNAIESLNSTYRKLNRQRSVFPSDKALLKALYLSTFEATRKWTTTLRNWAQVYGELSIMYEGRLPE